MLRSIRSAASAAGQDVPAAVTHDDREPRLSQDFEERLKAARRGLEKPERRADGMGAGMRIAVELAAAVLVGAGIGIVLDRWLGTSPWLLIVFFIIGTAAGFLNVYRTGLELERRAKAARAEAERERGAGSNRTGRNG